MSIYHLQRFSKMQFMCIHTRNMDTTGKLLQISSRFTQLESGLSKPFYTYNFYKIHYLITPTWFTNIWQYLTESHAKFHNYEPWIYTPPREHDFFLMVVVIRSNSPQSHIEIFNRVRLNLRLLTASGIIQCDSGHKILPNILKGQNYRGSSYNWPKHHNLPEKWIQVFCHIIKTVIQTQISSTNLGRWTGEGHQQWEYYANSNVQIVHLPSKESLTSLNPIDVKLSPNMQAIAIKPNESVQNTQHKITTPLESIWSIPTWKKKYGEPPHGQKI